MWRRDKRYVKVITECDKETMEGIRKIGRNRIVHDLLGLIGSHLGHEQHEHEGDSALRLWS